MTALRSVPAAAAPSSPVVTDDELMLLVAGDDRRAFRMLVERHQARLRRYLARMVGPGDADDLAQDVFLKLYSQRASYVGSGRFLPFLFRTARNRALNHIRWRRLRVLLGADDEKDRLESAHAADAEPTPAQLALLVDRQRSRLVQSLLLQMRPTLREVFVLRFVEGIDYPSIASVTGISEDNARARAHRSFAWLQARAKALEDA